ncbi:hypothetical protein BBN63_20850 [Streptomyces niveus]|uniref:Uncharacterized protein n=1 Tax=Streptomyces niveus TaxID=193462 RepID=A0A1U9QVL3_STRNV|nr:hypothetical protein BBN63_20850 [Streptomyces niveus]
MRTIAPESGRCRSPLAYMSLNTANAPVASTAVTSIRQRSVTPFQGTSLMSASATRSSAVSDRHSARTSPVRPSSATTVKVMPSAAIRPVILS